MKLGRKKRLIATFHKQLKERFPKYSNSKMDFTDSIHSYVEMRMDVPEDAEDDLKEFVEDFEWKINHTCSKCGQLGAFADPFCSKCEYRVKRRYSIKKMNAVGFSMFYPFYPKSKWVSVRWNALEKVELSIFETNLRLNFHLKPEFFFQQKYQA